MFKEPVLREQNDNPQEKSGSGNIPKGVRPLFSLWQQAGESAGKHMTAVVKPDAALAAIGEQDSISREAGDGEIKESQPGRLTPEGCQGNSHSHNKYQQTENAMKWLLHTR